LPPQRRCALCKFSTACQPLSFKASNRREKQAPKVSPDAPLRKGSSPHDTFQASFATQGHTR